MRYNKTLLQKAKNSFIYGTILLFIAISLEVYSIFFEQAYSGVSNADFYGALVIGPMVVCYAFAVGFYLWHRISKSKSR